MINNNEQEGHKDCESLGRIKHVEWIDDESINHPIPYHRHNIDIDIDELTLDIDIELAYLGYSMYNDDKYGTAYSLDLHQFNGDRR